MKIRGSITVFVSIILSALTAFSGIVIDLSRFRTGETIARAAVQLSVQSALTRYFAPLKDNYGLWANAYNKEELEEMIHDLIEKNLSTENIFMPGITDLFGFTVDNVTVYPVFSLTDEQVLEKQIVQYMKYRAPVKVAGLFAEKLKALDMFLDQSGLLNKRMELEDRLQELREKQVYLSLMLSEKISRFLNNGRSITEIDENIAAVSLLCSETENIEKADGELDRTYLLISSIIERIKKADSGIDETEQEISELEHELEILMKKGAGSEEIQYIRNLIQRKKDDLNDTRTSAEEEKERLRSAIDKCTVLLDEIRNKTETMEDKLTQARNISARFVRFHEESLKLVADIMKSSEEIRQMSKEINAEISSQSEKSDNAFLVKISTDMKKLVLTVDYEMLKSVKKGLEENLEALNEFNSALASAITGIGETRDSIKRVVEKIEKIEKTLNYTDREIFSPRLFQHVSRVKERLDFAVSVYVTDSYKAEPDINLKEKNEFYIWCNKVFNENNKTENRDRGNEKKLRENIKKADSEGKKEYSMVLNGKDVKMNDMELEELFGSLPSSRTNEKNPPAVDDGNNDKPEEKYKNFLDSNGNISAMIGNFLSDTGESVLKSLYINEYIVSAFKNANIDKVPVQRISVSEGPAKTFFEKAEVEYIIFGSKKEKTNVSLAQASIFGIRMGLNLLHVYMNSKKTSAALSAALSISGWTGFGVPVVKNLIVLGWAAGESYLDLRDLNNGQAVPVYKTENTWKLSLDSLFSGIAGKFFDKSSEWLKNKSDELTNKADDAVKAMIHELVNAAVNEVFLPLEQAVTDTGDENDTSGNMKITVEGLPNEVKNMGDLKNRIYELCREQYRIAENSVSDWTMASLEQYKNMVAEEITHYITESPTYKNILSVIKNNLDSIIDEGTDLVSEIFEDIGNSVADRGMKSRLLGSVVAFDYADYLGVLLVTVPLKVKLLRAADIIQLNLRETLDNPDFKLSEYNTLIVVEADISMKSMFIPSFLKTGKTGKFKIRWGYGY